MMVGENTENTLRALGQRRQLFAGIDNGITELFRFRNQVLSVCALTRPVTTFHAFRQEPSFAPGKNDLGTAENNLARDVLPVPTALARSEKNTGAGLVDIAGIDNANCYPRFESLLHDAHRFAGKRCQRTVAIHAVGIRVDLHPERMSGGATVRCGGKRCLHVSTVNSHVGQAIPVDRTVRAGNCHACSRPVRDAGPVRMEKDDVPLLWFFQGSQMRRRTGIEDDTQQKQKGSGKTQSHLNHHIFSCSTISWRLIKGKNI